MPTAEELAQAQAQRADEAYEKLRKASDRLLAAGMSPVQVRAILGIGIKEK